MQLTNVHFVFKALNTIWSTFFQGFVFIPYQIDIVNRCRTMHLIIVYTANMFKEYLKVSLLECSIIRPRICQ